MLQGRNAFSFAATLLRDEEEGATNCGYLRLDDGTSAVVSAYGWIAERELDEEFLRLSVKVEAAQLATPTRD